MSQKTAKRIRRVYVGLGAFEMLPVCVLVLAGDCNSERNLTGSGTGQKSGYSYAG